MTTLDQRCPQCAALVRAGSGWCTLCHADLRPAPEPEPVLDPPEELVEVVDLPSYDELVAADDAPLAAPTTAPVPRVGGKHAKPAPTPTAAAAAASGQDYSDLLVDIDDPEVMFALLRADGRDPILSKFEGPLSSPGARAMLIVGGGLGLAAVLFLLLALVGTLMR